MGILAHAQEGSVLLGYDPHYRSIVALARTLWLHGYPDQAADRANEAVKASEAMGHSAALALVLAGAGTVYLWRGDLDAAQHYVDRSYSLAEANAMGPLMAISRCRNAELTIRRGDVRQGVDDLRSSLKPIHAARHELLTTEFNMELALGLMALGQATNGLVLVDEAIARVNASGELFQLPELLRVKGKLHLAVQASDGVAPDCFQQALDLARAQGARAWELRAAIWPRIRSSTEIARAPRRRWNRCTGGLPKGSRRRISKPRLICWQNAHRGLCYFQMPLESRGPSGSFATELSRPQMSG